MEHLPSEELEIATVTSVINNAFYDDLGIRWYEADDDPVALLRAEAAFRNPMVADWIRDTVGPRVEVLDVACGAGFLSNALALSGHRVVGLDASSDSLRVAREHDGTASVRYEVGDAYRLPYADASFDAVCCMDFLEHVERPQAVIRECARVLRPSGRFFFYTFNRNPLSWLIVIKGVEWFVANTPPNMHVYRLFIKPSELQRMCGDADLRVCNMVGTRPVLSAAFWRLLWTRRVPADFQFALTRSLLISYLGMAVKH